MQTRDSGVSIISNRKYYKRNKILNIIRCNKDVSRYDIKKITSYSMSTVLDIVDELIRNNLIYEVDCDESRVGRKPVWLRINPSGGYFIGVEFNALRLHCAILNFSGETVCRTQADIFPTDTSDIIIEKIKTHINNALSQIKESNPRIFGICIGVPGYLDKKKGIAISYANLNNWRDVPVKKIIEKEYGIKCYIENNVNVMAFAYKWLSFNGDAKDMVFVSVRTGARLIPIIDNKIILRDKQGFTGELGHVKVVNSSRLCSCGRTGCLNSEISDFAVVFKILEGIRVGRFKEILEMVGGDTSKITMEVFRRSVAAGHPESLALAKSLAETLGGVLGVVVNILSPQIIVLSGELAKIGDVFINTLRESIIRDSVVENAAHLTVKASDFDDYIGAVGAAAFVMQEEFEFIDKDI